MASPPRPQSPATTDVQADEEQPTYTYTPTTTSTSSMVPPADPNISLRTFIYFLPHPLPPTTPVPYTPGLPHTNPLDLPRQPFEPTTTLVLTSPRGTFVDLRYLKDSSDGRTTNDPATIPNPNPNAIPSTTAAPPLLDWAFAGRSSSSPAPQPHPIYGPYTLNAWTHWVDSRARVGAAVPVDEGAMYSVGGGYVEHGVAFHPQLGRVSGHEEGWVDVDCAVGASSTGEKSRVCVVLRCGDDDAAGGVRGVVVRVAQFVQGIVMVGDRVATERWEFGGGLREQGETGTGWKRTARTGEWFLPCAVTWQTERVQVGGKVRFGEFEWVVEEAWVW